MAIIDPVADLLARIRNAQQARHKVVTSPYSKLRESILKVFKEEGYIRSYSVNTEGKHKALEVELKFFEGKPVIQELKRVSTPGRRVYSTVASLPKVHNGLGTVLLSTNRGVLSDAQAREMNVGGEILCTIY